MQPNITPTEIHPLEPFLPPRAVLLMMGSFPPKRERWSMDFYYPNLQNDMWRFFGWIFFHNKNHFLREDKKAFCRERIAAFLEERGIALCDTGYEVARLKDNASDKFLEIVTPRDPAVLLEKLPYCRAIATTGQKATETILTMLPALEPKVGRFTEFPFGERMIRLYRMPSSSRAYPRPIEEKAETYRKMLAELGLL